jgi:hypothetical protein
MSSPKAIRPAIPYKASISSPHQALNERQKSQRGRKENENDQKIQDIVHGFDLPFSPA